MLERLKADGFDPGPPPTDVTELPSYTALLLGAMMHQVLGDRALKPEVQLRLLVQIGDRIEKLQDAAKAQATIRALRAELAQVRAEAGRTGPRTVEMPAPSSADKPWPAARRGRPPSRAL